MNESDQLIEDDAEWFRELQSTPAVKAFVVTKQDLLVVALHGLTLQLGFNIKDGEQQTEWPANMKTKAGYTLHYTFREAAQIQMSIFELGSLVRVHALLLGEESETFSVSLSVNDWVVVESEEETVANIDLNLPGSSQESCVRPYGFKLTNLTGLAQLVNSQVGYPLLQAAKVRIGIQSGSILTLPPEVLVKVLKYLTAESVLNLGETCNHLNSLTKDAALWKFFLRRDFNRSDDDVEDPRGLYKMLWQSRTHSRLRHNPSLTADEFYTLYQDDSSDYDDDDFLFPLGRRRRRRHFWLPPHGPDDDVLGMPPLPPFLNPRRGRGHGASGGGCRGPSTGPPGGFRGGFFSE